MKFQDHFSRHAADYAQYRPHYPPELYAFLAGLTAEHSLAWDCATGNGQAARGLAQYYDQVIATDASEAQIRQAEPYERITYRVEPAEQTSLESGTVDLITVAIAVHWFDFDRFYLEVRRVLKPEGIIAVWTYHFPVIDPRVDELIVYLYEKILGDFWPERIRYIETGYTTLPFPFQEITPPEFAMQAQWNLDQLLGFMNSWTAVRRYEEARGQNPLEMIWEDFRAAWGQEDQVRAIRWPLYMRVGRNHAVSG